MEGGADSALGVPVVGGGTLERVVPPIEGLGAGCGRGRGCRRMSESASSGLQFQEVRRPETCHLRNPASVNTETEERQVCRGHTGSQPLMAENSTVPQPGFMPDVMSFRPARPSP